MSSFDLNQPTDFAALTSAFGSVFGPAQDQVWDVVESTYNPDRPPLVPVTFHVFKSSLPYNAAVPRVHDRGGRRKVPYEFPFRDGQTTGDLGRRPMNFEFDILFHGPNYIRGYQNLINALNQPTPGVLTHPVLGDIRCVPIEWEVTHESNQRMALAMRVSFAEHTYDAGLPFKNKTGSQTDSSGGPSTFKQAMIAAVTAFRNIDNALAIVQANVAFASSLKNGIVQEIQTYKDEFLLTLQSIYLTFNPDKVSLTPDLPGVLPVNLGGQATTSGTQASNLYPFQNQSQTPFAEVSSSSSQTPTALSVIEAQDKVNSVRASAESIVASLNSADPLGNYDAVLAIKQGALQMQVALQQGIASSNAQTTTFTVPDTIAVMTVREVAFAIGLDVNDSDQITQLNPQILSANYIPGGTVLNIPVVNS